jgi:hypothetical protein
MNEEDSRRGRSTAFEPRTILIAGFVLVSMFAVGLMFAAKTYDAFIATLIGPILVFASLPALSRQASRENDRRLFWLLLIALLVKLTIGGIGQLYAVFEAYQGAADANGYYKVGLGLAQHFQQGDFTTGLHPLIGTNFIRILTGIVLSVIGPSRTAAFMLFSWLGFWGLFFFYRAYVIAMPDGRSRTYARLVFFLPSLVFWPSAIGKDAWMVAGLGIAAYGSARVLTGHTWRGLAIAGLGFWMGLMVRPHVVAIVGLGLASAALLRRPRWELRELAPVVKVLSFLAVAAVSLWLVSRSNSFLHESGLNPNDVNSSLNNIQSATSIGGSTFVPSILSSPRRAPAAALTVLFRPLFPDARTSQAIIAAIEGTLLLAFTLIRIRWIIAALRSVFRQPFVAMALVHTGLFVAAFSSVANFGLLARQRSSVLPFFLVLLSVPPKRSLFSSRDGPASSTEAAPRA